MSAAIAAGPASIAASPTLPRKNFCIARPPEVPCVYSTNNIQHAELDVCDWGATPPGNVRSHPRQLLLKRAPHAPNGWRDIETTFGLILSKSEGHAGVGPRQSFRRHPVLT